MTKEIVFTPYYCCSTWCTEKAELLFMFGAHAFLTTCRSHGFVLGQYMFTDGERLRSWQGVPDGWVGIRQRKLTSNEKLLIGAQSMTIDTEGGE